MKKRLLAILLVAAMVICVLPLSASADRAYVSVKGNELQNGVTYAKTASGDVKALAGIANDGTVKCDYAADGSATLYLNSVEIVVNRADYPQNEDANDIISSDVLKLNIVLTGDNKLSTDKKIDCIVGSNITLSGEGSLDIYTSDGTGISCSGALTFESVKFSAEAYSSSINAQDGDNINSSIVNINGASVIDLNSNNSVAILAEYKLNFNLTDGGSVKANAGSSGGLGAVVTFAAGNINLAEGNVITLPENGVVTEKQYDTMNLGVIAASAGATPADEVKVEYVEADPETFEIEKNNADNGTFTLKNGDEETDKAAKNTEITITPAPATGYEVESVTVSDGTSEITVTKSDDVYKFTMPDKKVTVTVTFKAKTFTVNFDLQGKGTAIASQAVKYNEKAVKPTAPTNDGYTFAGWFTDMECTKAYNFDTKVTADLTLYAKWVEDTVVPNTGDENNIVLLAGLMLISVVGACVVFRKKMFYI